MKDTKKGKILETMKGYFMKKNAFTLAEVLITLGIIGIVAAMTLPGIIANYQKRVWVNQLKKTVSTIEQGFQKMLADDGVDKIEDTSAWSVFVENSNMSMSPNFSVELKKYFNISIEPLPLYGSESSFANQTKNSICLADGSVIWGWNFVSYDHYEPDTEACNVIKQLGGKMCRRVGTFYVDVNGKKAPNTYGRDIFSFAVGENGKLYPYGGKDYALFFNQADLSTNNSYWKNLSVMQNPNGCSGAVENGLKKAPSMGPNGIGCTGRVVENGWVMDY